MTEMNPATSSADQRAYEAVWGKNAHEHPGALHGAVYAKALDTVQGMLRAGADPNDQDDDGLTPLHVAVILDRPEIVEVLLEGGADQRIQDFVLGWTPLHYAAAEKSTASAKILLNDQRTQAQMDEIHKIPRERTSGSCVPIHR